MNEFKNVATIDFCVTGGSLEDAYSMMKDYQLVGQAGEDANIIYRGVSIPAGYCESVEEVEALYQVLKMDSKKESVSREVFSSKVEVDFYTEEDNLQEVFECMLQYRDHGYADRNSNIVYQGVVIPAGHCDTYSDLEAMYHSMIFGDIQSFIDSLSLDVVSLDIFDQYETERERITHMEEIPAILSHPSARTYQK